MAIDTSLDFHSFYQHVASVSFLGMLLYDVYKAASVQLKCFASGSWETGPSWSTGSKAFKCYSLSRCLLNIWVLETQSELGPVCKGNWIQAGQQINKMFSDNVKWHNENSSGQ